MSAAPSYASGVSTVPLSGETIGQMFDRIAAEHAEADALVAIPQGVRWTYGELAKAPRYVRFVDAFPLTVTGKIRKFKMRELEIEERGLAAAAATQTA